MSGHPHDERREPDRTVISVIARAAAYPCAELADMKVGDKFVEAY